MQQSSVFSVLSFLTFFTFVYAQGDSCHSTFLRDKHRLLSSICYSRRTSQDLNLCLANVDGNLVPRNGGNFSGSCWSCIYQPLENNRDMINCSCRRKNGTVNERANINLNDFMHSTRDGYMWCFGHRSAPY